MQNKKSKNKIFLKIIIAFLMLAGFFAQNVSARSIKLGIESLPFPYQTVVQIDWLKNNFDLISGVNTTSYSNGNSIQGMTKEAISSFAGYGWMKYHDICTLDSFASYLNLVDYANSVGINHEEMLLHAKNNFTYAKGVAWSGADKFDAFENAKGVMLENGGIFTDKTAEAYSGASPYTTISQNLYIGYELPFDQANFDVRTPAVGLVGNWQYYKKDFGWSNLAVNDGTFASGTTLNQNGALSFSPPGDWDRTIVNGSRNKYFIRFVYASATTSPTINTIKGDQWYNDGISSHVRGWNSSDPAIINSGELAYNPNAGSGVSVNASAKFRHQSRVPTWGPNHFVYNFADYQNINSVLTRTTSAYLAYMTIGFMNDFGWTGMMYDDATAGVTVGGVGIDSSNTDFADKAGGLSWTTVENAKYADLVSSVKAVLPNVKLGANSKKRIITNFGDWNYYEYVNYGGATGDGSNTLLATTDSVDNMTYDDYSPPSTKSGLMTFADTVDRVAGDVEWDRSNRGPISMLSKHLIGANSNTYFAYITQGGAIYDLIDDVFYLDPVKGTTLTQSLVPDSSTNAKMIYGADFSNFPSGALTIKIDGTPEVLSVTKVNNTTLSTTAKIYSNHAIGSVVRFSEMRHFTDGTNFPIGNVWRWGTFFPAMAVDFGTSSARNMNWALGTTYGWGSGQNNNVWSRDYFNALVLHRSNGGPTGTTDYATYSAILDLGGTYYPLYADGTTGSAITSIQLRRGEGAILMKAPIANDVTPPSAPTGLGVI